MNTAVVEVWNNKFLRSEIFKHLEKFTFNLREHKKTICQLEVFEHKEYLTKLYLLEDEPNDGTVKEIPMGLIPHSIKVLCIKANIKLLPGHLKEGLECLYTSPALKEINFNVIPSSITKVIFSNNTKVIIPQTFNNYKNIKYLAVGKQSTQFINHIYKFANINTLVIDGCIGQSKDLIIPDGIYHFILGWEFKKPLPQLPNSLLSLSIGSNFRYQFSLSSLPTSLRYINIRSIYIVFNFEEFKRFPNLIILQFTDNLQHPLAEPNIDLSKVLLIFPKLEKLFINQQMFEKVDGVMTKIDKKRKI